MTLEKGGPDSGRKLFYGLFVFPLLIAVGMAVLLSAVVFLTHERQTADTLIAAIKTGTPSKRWEKAYELSNELNRTRGSIRSEGLMREIIRILRDAEGFDAKTRTYTAVALGRFRHPEADAALADALADADEGVRLHALWSLGASGSREQAPRIRPFLADDSAEMRKVAAYVLGAVGDRESAAALRGLLDDSAPDVRWNAALALARLGDASGVPTLSRMLDRSALREDRVVDGERVRQTMINAAKGLALIGGADSIKILESVSKQDPDLKVRQAALEAAAYIRERR